MAKTARATTTTTKKPTCVHVRKNTTAEGHEHHTQIAISFAHLPANLEPPAKAKAPEGRRRGPTPAPLPGHHQTSPHPSRHEQPSLFGYTFGVGKVPFDWRNAPM